MLSRTLSIALDGTLPACLTVRSQVSSQDALKHTPKHTLQYTPNCTRWHTPSLLDTRSQAHSKYAHKYTSEYVLEYTPGHALKDSFNCTRWHTPSLLDCTLPSTLPGMLSRTLPIALDGTLPASLTVRSEVSSQEGRHSQSYLTICSHVCSCMLDPETC
jgi:hypothetical protein